MHIERNYYEHEYHYAEDISIPDIKRIGRFFGKINLKKEKKFLDIGCGVGTAVDYCARRGLRCYGFDISLKAIKMSHLEHDTRAITLVANGEHLPYRSDHFDIVSSLGSVEHFSSVEKGLAEIRRVTKKDGQVLLVVPNSFWVLNKLQLYRGTEQPQEMLATIGEWARLFKKHGLIIKAVEKDFGPKIFKNRNPLGIVKRAALKITMALPTAFAYQFIFICRRK